MPDTTAKERRERARQVLPSGVDDRRPPVVAATGSTLILGTTAQPGAATRAHGGILAADGIDHWELRPATELFLAGFKGQAVDRTNPRRLIPCDCRITASATGCLCREPAADCHCNDADRSQAAQRLWSIPNYYLFDIACGASASGCNVDRIDTRKVRELVRRARLFAARTRHQKQPNARTDTGNQRRGWTMTRAARSRLTVEVRSDVNRQRVVQVARSAADIDECMRMQERHIDTALGLTEPQRRHLDA